MRGGEVEILLRKCVVKRRVSNCVEGLSRWNHHQPTTTDGRTETGIYED